MSSNIIRVFQPFQADSDTFLNIQEIIDYFESRFRAALNVLQHDRPALQLQMQMALSYELVWPSSSADS